MKRIVLSLSISLLIGACNSNLQQANDFLEEGITFENAGKVDTALTCYNRAIELFEQTGNKEQIGETYNRIGSLFLNNELYHDACEVFQHGLKYNLTLKDKSKASYSLRGIAKSYAYQQMPEQALNYHLKTLPLISQIKDTDEIINIYNNLANTYFFLGQDEKATYYNTLTLQLAKDSATIYRCYSIKAGILAANHEYDSAKVYLEKGTFSNNLYTKTSCYLQLSELAKQTGDSNYTNYLEKSSILKDSIERLNKSSDIANADKQFLRKDTTQKIQHLFKIGIPTIVLLIIIGLSFFFLQRKRHRYKILAEKHHAQTLKEELQQMKEKLSEAQEQQVSEEELAHKKQAIQDQSNAILKEIKKIGITCRTKFIKSENYAIIQKKILNEDLSFSSTESKKYRNSILKDFNPYIIRLNLHASLPQEDSYLCCLLLLGFSTQVCAALRSVSNNAIRTQKHRLREKINKTFLSDTSFDKLYRDSQK